MEQLPARAFVSALMRPQLLLALVTALAIAAGTVVGPGPVPGRAFAEDPRATDPPAAGTAQVTYVANAGFLLEGGGRKVLIDALFDRGIEGYATIPEDLRPALEGARPPFDGVDLVLATHFHRDHFAPRSVTRHLEANPRARFLSTPQAVEEVRALAGDRPAIAERAEALWPEEGVVETMNRGGVRLGVVNLHHGRDRRPPVENLGFLIELGGVTLLHVGDTEVRVEEVEALDLPGRGIDVGLLPVWYLTYDGWARVTREQIRPRRIVGIHLATPDAPDGYFGPDRGYEARLKALRERFPEVILLLEAGESATFAAGAP